ncbi:hypothetical protein ACFCX4_27885 [Kitasatospora sp. NPDC056327]|uniref:hypothetical protein n=1 Tax=Kitasatospora sp. NPDC056327 TaxID=3345785 RepID=UPI0035DB2096
MAPPCGLALAAALFAPGGVNAEGHVRPSAEGFVRLAVLVLVVTAVPALPVLFSLSFAVARGYDVRVAAALLLSAPPALLLLAGYLPVLLLIALGLFYVFGLLPVWRGSARTRTG